MTADRETLEDDQILKDDFLSFVGAASEALLNGKKKRNAELQAAFRTLLDTARNKFECERREEEENIRSGLAGLSSALEIDIQRRVKLLKDTLGDLASEYSRVSSPVNIFSILHAKHSEDPQSYLLGRLLDPSQPHGFSDRILRPFLKKACDISGEVDYDSLDISGVKVEAQKWLGEPGVVDIEVSGRNFICAIENKVLAGETGAGHDPQTRRYAEHYTTLERRSPQHLLLLYLVPPPRHPGEQAKQPSDPRFKQILYSDVVEIVHSAMRTSSLNADSALLIGMFLNNARLNICHEFDFYLAATTLIGNAGHNNPEYFAHPDSYSRLASLLRELSKEAAENA